MESRLIKSVVLFLFVVSCTTTVSAEFIQTINIQDGLGSNQYNYYYDRTVTKINTNTKTLYDAVTRYKIFLANLEGGKFSSNDLANFRLSVLDSKNTILKTYEVPFSLQFSFDILSVDFYPTKIMGSKKIYGSVIIKTNRGDIFLDLKDLSCELILYGKKLFRDKTDYVKVIDIAN